MEVTPECYPMPFDQLRFVDFNGDHTTDIFWRLPSGEWRVTAPGGVQNWRVLGGSSFPLSALRFGDFDGDKIPDIVAVENGHWSYSRNGTEICADLNKDISTPLDSPGLFVGDIDADW